MRIYFGYLIAIFYRSTVVLDKILKVNLTMSYVILELLDSFQRSGKFQNFLRKKHNAIKIRWLTIKKQPSSLNI